MASYGYGGSQNVTYGSKGDADGGGFTNTQSGSQDSPGGKGSTYGKDTLRPVTVKQIIDAQQPHPDSEFKVDGSEVTQVTFIGQIHTINSQTTNTTYTIDDGTGLVDVKQWVDSEAAETSAPAGTEGQYVRVMGRMKQFNTKRHVAAHVIRPIEDFNEISYHFLEATAVHLYFTRGPPEANGIKTEGGGGMFVDSHGGDTNGGADGGRKALYIGATPEARKVWEVLLSAPQNNEGLNVHEIARQVGLSTQEVFKAGDQMLAKGAIYTTVDDETWAVLEY